MLRLATGGLYQLQSAAMSCIVLQFAALDMKATYTTGRKPKSVHPEFTDAQNNSAGLAP